MKYKVWILRRAQKELANLPVRSYTRIRNAIRDLSNDPRPRGCLKLKQREGWRIRIGNYRIIYEINNNKQVVTILHIGHRRDVYR